MARIAAEEIERIKREVTVERLGVALRGRACPPRCRAHRALPVPRRPDAVAGHQPAEESL